MYHRPRRLTLTGVTGGMSSSTSLESGSPSSSSSSSDHDEGNVITTSSTSIIATAAATGSELTPNDLNHNHPSPFSFSLPSTVNPKIHHHQQQHHQRHTFLISCLHNLQHQLSAASSMIFRDSHRHFHHHHHHHHHHKPKGRTTSTTMFFTFKVVLRILSVVLVVERAYFNVKFVLMGRPGWIYGTPTDWNTVKGCFIVKDKDAMSTETRTKPISKMHGLPLNPDVHWEWKYYSAEQVDQSNSTTAGLQDPHQQSEFMMIPASSTHRRPRRRRRLLVAQYTGFGKYSQMLDEVAPINKAYAKKWGHDYVSLQGTAIYFPDFIYPSASNNADEDGNDGSTNNGIANATGATTIDMLQRGLQQHDQEDICRTNNYEAQSTFNKIPLLLRALDEKDGKHGDRSSSLRYDQVLILDTDTMIVDFDFDITSLLVRQGGYRRNAGKGTTIEDPSNSNVVLDAPSLQHDYMLAAYRVWWHDWTSTWDVNAGITLWNLHHPLTLRVADAWWRLALDRPRDVLLKNDDQFFLQRALIDLGFWQRWGAVKTVRKEMEYYHGSVIKHFKRDARSWSTTGLDQRILRIREVKETICQTWPVDCQRVFEEDEEEPVRYSNHLKRQEE